MYKKIVKFIQDTYETREFIPLHAPQFNEKDKKYVCNAIESTFVSSTGEYVDQFEEKIERFTGVAKAVATINGTAALHMALYMAGVKSGDLVITQAVTFVATCDVLLHMGAEPVFIDISKKSLGLCPKSVEEYLEENAFINNDGLCICKKTGKTIRAVIPMHTFGHPVDLDELIIVCKRWHLVLVEDAAESLGSFYKKKHTGTFGRYSAISFNGNKIITTGGGGMILCSDIKSGQRLKHITTTAKVNHPYEYIHDEAGFNYRLPNINAALGCAQMEVLPGYIKKKRELAKSYELFFRDSEVKFFKEPQYAKSNYWLNSIICPDYDYREIILKETNKRGVMTRPVWRLMHKLPMFNNCRRGDLKVSEWLESRLVNIPSSPILRGQ